MQRKYRELKAEAAKVGLYFFITRTASILLEQQTLYLQGRESLEEVNHWREVCNWAPITEEQNKKVTWTLNSKHLINTDDLDYFNDHSLAFDIVLCDKNHKNIHWNDKADVNANEIPDYEELAKIGRRIDIDCGADFKDEDGKPTPDWVHFQQPEGITGFEK